MFACLLARLGGSARRDHACGLHTGWGGSVRSVFMGVGGGLQSDNGEKFSGFLDVADGVMVMLCSS